MLTKSERTRSLNSCWTMLSIVAFLVIAPMAAGSSANAANFSFTQIDVPGAISVRRLSASTTRGRSSVTFSDSTGSPRLPQHRRQLHPNRRAGRILYGRYGINDAGQIVGTFSDSTGSPRLPRHRRQLHPNRRAGRILYGALSASTTRGRSSVYFGDSTGDHGFLDTGGSFTPIDVPGAFSTRAHGINDAGQIVGSFSDSTGVHGFLDTGGSFTPIDVPGAISTDALGINDAGQIVGDFYDSTGSPRLPLHRRQLHPNRRAGRSRYGGFRHQRRGADRRCFLPTARVIHGFLATPTAAPVPEPSTLTLLSVGIGLTVLCVMRRREEPIIPKQ